MWNVISAHNNKSQQQLRKPIRRKSTKSRWFFLPGMAAVPLTPPPPLHSPVSPLLPCPAIFLLLFHSLSVLRIDRASASGRVKPLSSHPLINAISLCSAQETQRKRETTAPAIGMAVEKNPIARVEWFAFSCVLSVELSVCVCTWICVAKPNV